MSDAVTRARSLLEDRKRSIEGELVDIEKAIAALGGKARPTSGRPRRSVEKKSRTSRRVPRAKREEQLLDVARQNPESSNADLAKRLGVTPAYVSQMMSSLKSARRLERREGRIVVKG